MSHDEALELAGLYALDALTPDEKAEVDAHLAELRGGSLRVRARWAASRPPWRRCGTRWARRHR